MLGVQQQIATAAPIFIAFDLSSADPKTYDHAQGGGAWNDGPATGGVDVEDEHTAQDFACGDIVSFFVQIKTDSTAGLDPAARTVQLDLMWDAGATLYPGAGYTDIVATKVNYGPVSNGAGPGSTDAGMSDDGGSTATIINRSLTAPYQLGGKLRGTLEVTDVEVNEQIIVRIDVRLSCLLGAEHGGILYAAVDQSPTNTGAREISPEPRDLQVALLRQQMLQIGLLANANFSVALTPNPPSLIAPGGPVTYTVSVTNLLPRSPLLIDSLQDDRFGDLALPTANTTCVLPWVIGSGATASCTYIGTVTGGVGTTVSNTIVAEGGGSIGAATATVGLTGDPHLSLAKSVQSNDDRDGSGNFTAGDVLTFALIVTNTGNVALTGVVVTDSLPGVSAVNCGGFNGSLGVGASATCTATYTVTLADDAAHKVVNTATADSNQTTATATTVMIPLADAAGLSVTVTTSPPGTFKAGDTVTVQLRVCNTGGRALSGVVATEQSSNLSQTVGSLAIGDCQNVTSTYVVTVTDVVAGTHVFQGSADSDQTPATTGSASVAVEATRGLAIDVSANIASVVEGNPITFTVKVKNTGNVALSDVMVSDSAAKLSELVASIAPGGTKTFTVSYVPSASEVLAGKVLYVGTAASSRTGAVNHDVTVTVLAAPPLPKVTPTIPFATPSPPVTVRTSLPVTGATETNRYLMLSFALAAAGFALLVAGRGKTYRY